MRVKEESEKASLQLNIKKKKKKTQKLRSWHLVQSLHGKQKGKKWKQWQISSSWALKPLQMVTAAVKLEDNCFLAEKLSQTCVKKQRHHHFADKGPCSQSYGLSNSHIWLWKLDHKEGRALKNWCFWTVVLEKTLESPLDSKVKSVNPKGNQPWIFVGRNDAEAEAPILWPPDAKSRLTGKDSDAGKDWGQKRET